jgi:hypothetical protein
MDRIHADGGYSTTQETSTLANPQDTIPRESKTIISSGLLSYRSMICQPTQ